MSREMLLAADCVMFDGQNSGDGCVYTRLLTMIQETIAEHKLRTDQPTPPNNILRIGG